MSMILDKDNIKFETLRLVMGASESIDLLSGVKGIGSHITAEDLLVASDERIDVRWIQEVLEATASPGLLQERATIKAFPRYESINHRFVYRWPGQSLLIVDKARAIGSEHVASMEGIVTSITEDERHVAKLSQFFDDLWSGSEVFEIIYEDLREDKSDQDLLVTELQSPWDDLIKRLAKNPSQLYTMSPSNFEELVAELLLREGFRVKLTPRTRDGGCDILAFADSRIGEHLYLVECKRYARQHPIGVGLVRQLYGVVEHRRASAGLIVTTSYFTKDATRYHSDIKHRLSLKDYNALLSWLGAH